MEFNNLVCTTSVEETTSSGNVLKKTVHRDASFSLARNEFRDVILRLNIGKKELRYPLRDVKIHKKFVRDGKATISLPDHNVQFMLSNCPPDKLIMFLKTMHTKLECLKKKGFVSERQKLKSELPRMIQEISPLTMKDLQTVHEMRAKEMEKSNLFTPKGKRKRNEMDSDDKENVAPKEVKVARKLLVLAGPSKPVLAPVSLNKEQNEVLSAVMQGKNVFFTGSAGTGKSFLLRRIIGALPPQHTVATASTGIAACHIGGTTLHSFAGIGSGRAPLEQCIELASRPQVTQHWKRCHHLIIDEISMVDGDFFDKLETVARVIRLNDRPFGGIQLIVCGDFLQLPPVARGKYKRKFCFQSKAWQKAIEINMELKEVRRQSDKHFVNVLQNIRLGRCPDFVSNTLRATAQNNIEKHDILATRLCTHKDDVDHINQFHLKNLPGQPQLFISTDTDPVYEKQIDFLSPVPGKLELKLGAQVMLAKNLDVQQGLVSGARGVVLGFDKGNEGLPLVKFLSGTEVVIKPIRWTFKVNNGLQLTRKQVPLKLAWAISIHKSQGMTLDCVEISLSRVFESGQSYVALSRAKSLEGLRVLDFDSRCIRADPEVLRFYHKLQLHQRIQQTGWTLKNNFDKFTTNYSTDEYFKLNF
ncbi:hypothetical protein CHS0354_022179 [Potamilus streckersoni]|uniref:ATP-dependent DNA helicase PIF1 n=1 Tax=Potamilus streckersoni TaxID=2493646 RepID=A0AAE0RT94_9BIVA|nr:hypothetical protein CHS0354_022179 [Potamilus streckersoni]